MYVKYLPYLSVDCIIQICIYDYVPNIKTLPQKNYKHLKNI